jgi:hypothetical protein
VVEQLDVAEEEGDGRPGVLRGGEPDLGDGALVLLRVGGVRQPVDDRIADIPG